MTTAGVGLVTPLHLDNMSDPVSTGLLRKGWASEVEFESVLADPIIGKTEFHAPLEVAPNDVMALPRNKIIMDVTPKGAEGKSFRSITMAFKKALAGTGRFGDAENILGNEETLQLKYVTCFANDNKHGVTQENYGINFREIEPYQVYKTIKADLVQWRDETEGYQFRDGFFKGFSFNLTKSPLSKTVPYNPNWYLMDGATAPTWSATAATFAHNIGAAIKAATAANMRMTVPRLQSMAKTAEQNKYIKPVNGMYILAAHPDDVAYLLDPSVSGSWGSYWLTGAALQDARKLFPGAVGLIDEHLLVVRDPRACTLTVGGTASAYTLTVGYMKQGRTSTRATGTTSLTHCNLHMLLGENAIWSYQNEAPHFEGQLDEYRQYEGVGYLWSKAYGLPIWDVDTPSASTAQYEGGMAVVTQRF